MAPPVSSAKAGSSKAAKAAAKAANQLAPEPAVVSDKSEFVFAGHEAVARYERQVRMRFR